MFLAKPSIPLHPPHFRERAPGDCRAAWLVEQGRRLAAGRWRGGGTSPAMRSQIGLHRPLPAHQKTKGDCSDQHNSQPYPPRHPANPPRNW